jgi:hypothetical protein
MDVIPSVPSPVTPHRPSRNRLTGGLTMGLALVLVACGGGAPPAGNPPGGTGAVPNAPNAQPTPRPATGSLADLLPNELGGQSLELKSGTGQAGLDLLTNADVASVTQQVEKLRLTVDQLIVAEAGDIDSATDAEGIGIVAVRVPGVLFTPSSGPQTRFVSSLMGIPANARTGYATLANRTTTTILDPAGLTKTYVYGPTEVIFIVRGPENLAEEAFSKISLRP